MTASPQTTCPRSVSSRRATYRVRPDTRTWAGTGSPSAEATNDGAAMAEPDSTAQSLKKVLIRSPRLVLKIARTSRRSGLTSVARRAAWKLPRSSWRSRASARADCTLAAVNACASSSVCSMTVTPGSRAMSGPRSRRADGMITVTCSPYRAVSSSTTRSVSESSPQAIRWPEPSGVGGKEATGAILARPKGVLIAGMPQYGRGPPRARRGAA